MQAKPKYQRKWAISRNPDDLNNPANAPYLYEGPDGDRFIDWRNPNHRLENWADRIEVLASGDEQRINQCYEQLYCQRLADAHRFGPDHVGEGAERQPHVTDMPPSLFPLAAEEVLRIMRQLKSRISQLERQKFLLAQEASQGGCPQTGSADCPLRDFPANLREPASCAACWMRYADSRIAPAARDRR